jgi:hypothetical protein
MALSTFEVAESMSEALLRELVEAGLARRDQIDEALRTNELGGGSPMLRLSVSGVVDPEALAAFFAKRFNVPRVTHAQLDAATRQVLEVLPADYGAATGLAALGVAGPGRLLVAVVDPSDRESIGEAEFVTGCAFELVVATPLELAELFERVGSRRWRVATDELRRRAEVRSTSGQLRTLDAASLRRDADEVRSSSGIARLAAVPASSTHGPATRSTTPAPAKLRAPSPRGPIDAAQPVGPEPGLPSAARITGGFSRDRLSRLDLHGDLTPLPENILALLRRPDDADSAARSGLAPHGRFDLTAPMLSSMGAGSPAVRASLAAASRAISGIDERDALAGEFAECLGLVFPTVMIFSLRIPRLVVWAAASEGFDARLIRGRSFELVDGSAWQTVVDRAVCFEGRLGATDPARALLRGVLDGELLIVPIVLSQRVVALLVVAGSEARTLPVPGSDLGAAVSAFTDRLRALIVARKRASEPSA